MHCLSGAEVEEPRVEDNLQVTRGTAGSDPKRKAQEEESWRCPRERPGQKAERGWA